MNFVFSYLETLPIFLSGNGIGHQNRGDTEARASSGLGIMLGLVCDLGPPTAADSLLNILSCVFMGVPKEVICGDHSYEGPCPQLACGHGVDGVLLWVTGSQHHVSLG